MLLQNLLNTATNTLTEIKDFINSLVVFLTAYVGSETMAYVTLGIVGFLGVALVLFFLIALFNPSKRKMKKLNKSLKRQKEYEALLQRKYQISEDIGAINLEMKIVERQCVEDIYNLNEIERSSLEQDELFVASIKHKISDLDEKQKILEDALYKHNKGLLKSRKKDKAESTQLLINDIIEQKNACRDEISQKEREIAQRKLQHSNDLNNLKNALNNKLAELNKRKSSLEAERLEIEKKIEKSENSGRHKLTLADAMAMTDDFARKKKLADKEAEEQAAEALKIAKANYEEAYKRRLKAEKDKSVAVENVKALQKQKVKVKNLKSADYSPVPVATAVRSNEKPDDVNIIIADIDSGIVFNPVPELKTVIDETIEEHEYQEPTVEVVDFDNLPEEDVVFIEAFLDYLNVDADDETILDEAAITGETSIAFDNEEQPKAEAVVELGVDEAVAPEITEDGDAAAESASTEDSPVVEIEITEGATDGQSQADGNRTEEIESTDSLEQAELEGSQDTAEDCEDAHGEDSVGQSEESISDAEQTVAANDTEQNEELTAVTVERKQAEVLSANEIAEEKPKAYPAYKDYNDGIPATPIYKKSKFQKPVTKLVKKTKPSTPEQNQPAPTEPKASYSGKWAIEQAEGKFLAKLVASNGGVLLTTGSYSSENGVKGCIESVKAALSSDSAVVVSDKEGKYFFKVLSPSKRTILQSAKYSTKYQCEKSLASAKIFAQKAIIR